MKKNIRGEFGNTMETKKKEEEFKLQEKKKGGRVY